MENFILDKIRMLRKQEDININRENYNRYRLLVNEDNGSNTAYYFSTPIYGETSKSLVDPRFYKDGNSFSSDGSNAKITVNKNEVVMRNQEGKFNFSWGEKRYFLKDRYLISDGIELQPTLNGIVVKAKCSGNEVFKIHVSVDRPSMNIRANTKNFSPMYDGFKPYMTISAIGGSDSFGELCCPAIVSYQEVDEKSYSVNISATSNLSRLLIFEINMYEPKLFQDTTVESKNSDENNVFGGIAFLGDSEAFGEQWLYTRLDYTKLAEILDREIYKVQLHIPTYNDNEVGLAIFEVAQRFCSFASNWDNKIALSSKATEPNMTQNYHNIDLTKLMMNNKILNIHKSEGLILKSKVKGNGFSVIATSDNYYTPQILEINFR